MRKIKSLASPYCLVFFLIVGCDSGKVDTGVELLSASDAELVLSNGLLSVTLKDNGVLRGIHLIPDTAQPNRKVSVGSNLGLWVAGRQDGVKSNVMFDYLTHIDGFQLQHSSSTDGGLYQVTLSDFETGYENWISVEGAPTYSDGSPKMLGEAMIWGTYASATTTNNPESSFTDLDVVVNPYLFKNEQLKSTLFVRYVITNQSPLEIENFHLGFGGDIDLFLTDTNSEPINGPCGRFSTHWNNTGYDPTRNYTFTYVKPDSIDGDISDECYGTFVGYSIVGSSGSDGLNSPVLAHRVLTRWEEESFEGFNESSIDTPNKVLFALQGLSSEGASMIDPITQQPTRFAYTGNPVTETGWIDTRKDVRSLQSVSPITLAPGATVVTTVAIFTAVSPSFEQGFTALSTLYDAIIANRSKWDY